MVPQTPHDEYQQRSTLWTWFCGVLAQARVAMPCGRGDLSANVTQLVVPASAWREDRPSRGALLRFPVYGEALLVKLAEMLRGYVADLGPEHDPLLLTISRRPGSRLTIDRTAYVEFDPVRGAFHVTIEAESDTRVFLDTTDFDTLVRFIIQYVSERPPGPAALDAAS